MKKLLQVSILTIGTFLFAHAASAQWSLIHSIYNGAMASDGAVGFSIGDKGYIIAGATTSDYYMYDTTANTWTNKGTIPANMGQAFAMGFALHGKGYVVGGDTAGVPTNTVWRYDPTNTTTPWTQMNNFGGGTRDAGIAFVLNDTAYVGCGFDGSVMYADLWRYDEANDNWVQVPNTLPTTLIFPACFVVDGRAFILSGGTTGGVNETNQMWEYLPSTQSFTPRAPYPGAARQAAIAFAGTDHGFIAGGMAGYTTNYSDMYRYNPDSNTWSAAGSIPLFGSAWASVFTIGNTAYAGLGAKFVGSALQGTDSFFRYRMAVPTAVNDVKSYKQLAVYPNPVSDVLNIDLGSDVASELVIYNYLGEKVKEVRIVRSASVSVADLAPGYYMLRANRREDRWQGAFVKQ
jgi:N-acetylneuraminic acid mutarotase